MIYLRANNNNRYTHITPNTVHARTHCVPPTPSPSKNEWTKGMCIFITTHTTQHTHNCITGVCCVCVVFMIIMRDYVPCHRIEHNSFPRILGVSSNNGPHCWWNETRRYDTIYIRNEATTTQVNKNDTNTLWYILLPGICAFPHRHRCHHRRHRRHPAKPFNFCRVYDFYLLLDACLLLRHKPNTKHRIPSRNDAFFIALSHIFAAPPPPIDRERTYCIALILWARE